MYVIVCVWHACVCVWHVCECVYGNSDCTENTSNYHFKFQLHTSQPLKSDVTVINQLQKITLLWFVGEKSHGVWNSGAQWDQEVVNSKEITLSTEIKLVRYGVAR